VQNAASNAKNATVNYIKDSKVVAKYNNVTAKNTLKKTTQEFQKV
jgi:aspartate carbamoyltransferase regulatory subunit